MIFGHNFTSGQFVEQDAGYLCYDGQWIATVNRCNGYSDCSQGKKQFCQILGMGFIRMGMMCASAPGASLGFTWEGSKMLAMNTP